MTTQDAGVILGTALGTVALAVGLWHAPPVVATQADKEQTKEARLDTGDVQVSVRLDKPQYRAGDKPVVVVTAVNRSGCARSTNVGLEMSSTRPPSYVSRSVALPRPIWSEPCMIALPAHQSRTLELPTNVAVEAGSVLRLVAKAGDKAAVFSASIVPDAKLVRPRLEPPRVSDSDRARVRKGA